MAWNGLAGAGAISEVDAPEAADAPDEAGRVGAVGTHTGAGKGALVERAPVMVTAQPTHDFFL